MKATGYDCQSSIYEDHDMTNQKELESVRRGRLLNDNVWNRFEPSP